MNFAMLSIYGLMSTIYSSVSTIYNSMSTIYNSVTGMGRVGCWVCCWY